MTDLHTEHQKHLFTSPSEKIAKYKAEKIEALALRLFEQRMKESSMMPKNRAEDAITAARLFYEALWGVE